MGMSEQRKRQRVARGYSATPGRRPAPDMGRPYTTPGTKIRIVDDWLEVTPVGGDDRSTDIGPGEYTVEARYDRRGKYDGKKIYSRKTGKAYYVHDASYGRIKEAGRIEYLDDNWGPEDKPKKVKPPRSKVGDSRPVFVANDGSIFHMGEQRRSGKVLMSNLETGRSHWVSLYNLEHLYKKKTRDQVDIKWRGK